MEPRIREDAKVADSDASTVKKVTDTVSMQSKESIMGSKTNKDHEEKKRTPTKVSSIILNMKRKVANAGGIIGGKENVETVDLNPTRNIIKAQRRWTSGQKNEDSDEEDVPQPKFVFGAKLSSNVSLEDKEEQTDNNPFSFSFKATPIEEKKGDFGQVFKSEAKMFTNRNLFINPMIGNQQPASKRSKLKTENGDDAGKGVVVVLKKRESLGPANN